VSVDEKDHASHPPGRNASGGLPEAAWFEREQVGDGVVVPLTPVNDIVRGKRAITADTALRLARYFGTTPQFWMNLQANYDLDRAEDARGPEIAGRIQPHRAA
jgi:addiction module HigA family antidote